MAHPKLPVIPEHQPLRLRKHLHRVKIRPQNIRSPPKTCPSYALSYGVSNICRPNEGLHSLFRRYNRRVRAELFPFPYSGFQIIPQVTASLLAQEGKVLMPRLAKLTTHYYLSWNLQKIYLLVFNYQFWQVSYSQSIVAFVVPESLRSQTAVCN